MHSCRRRSGSPRCSRKCTLRLRLRSMSQAVPTTMRRCSSEACSCRSSRLHLPEDLRSLRCRLCRRCRCRFQRALHQDRSMSRHAIQMCHCRGMRTRRPQHSEPPRSSTQCRSRLIRRCRRSPMRHLPEGCRRTGRRGCWKRSSHRRSGSCLRSRRCIRFRRCRCRPLRVLWTMRRQPSEACRCRLSRLRLPEGSGSSQLRLYPKRSSRRLRVCPRGRGTLHRF